MRTLFGLITAIFIFTANTAHAQQQVFPCVGEVTSNAINIRCDATTSSKTIGAVNDHDIINIVAESFDWYKIRLPKDATCFINAKYVKLIEQGSDGAPVRTSFGIVNADSVNLRLEPNGSSCILGRINKDKVVNILEKQGDWFKVTPPDTACGWINKKFVKVLVTPQTATMTTAASIEPKTTTQEKPALAKAEGPEKTDTVTIVGIIEPYGKIIGRKGTHKITTDSKKTYILKGDKKMLNSCSYRKAAVRGALQDISGQPYPVISVEKIEVLN